MDERQKNILIIRFSSIGDILLTTPFVKQIRLAFPSAQITYLVKKEFSSLVEYNPNINTIMAYDSKSGYKGLIKLKNNLPNFDFIFDLHNNLRSNRITNRYSKEKIFKIQKGKFKRALLVFLKINLYDHIQPVAEKYLNTGKNLGIKDNEEKLELHWNGLIASSIKKILENYNLSENRYICIAPGAAHFTKMWPVKYSIDLISRILERSNYKIAILGGPRENNLITEFIDNKNVINLAGRLSLLESAGVIKHSRGIVTNDSGLMHMAAATGKPIIAIFGSTTQELGFFPFRADATIIENKEIWCRPCTHIGRGYCPLGHFACMKSLSVDYVFKQTALKIL
jgi:heptosyltransferase-2